MTNGPLRVNPGLLSPSGRGVKGGVPYGEQLLTEEDEMEQMHGMDGKKDALRAQTRKALRR